MVEDIRMLLDAVHDGTPVHIAGNSYGGTVAYGIALEHPDRVASMISLEAEPPTPAWADTMRETFQQAKEEIYKADAMVRAVAAYGLAGAKILKLSRRLAKETRFFEELPESATVSTETVAQLPVPVLAIYGSESWLFEQEPVMRSLLQNTTTVVVPEGQPLGAHGGPSPPRGRIDHVDTQVSSGP
ncbi:alpha/beta fold hydrolase [Acaricomes phytoseiuli]|uniref:alpha/beta fold hydrolase n=1 Tax=Acaricomes phytoseiuli TaxID=291968 RepID=UPI001FDF6A1E|nr:alpha/beta fold hydrolase [Acaricomes phytoseiuli]